MSSISNYDIGTTPALPSRNVVFNNIKAPTGEITNLSVSLINGLPPPSAPPIAAPVNSILTVTSPGVATFTDSAILTDLDVDGDIKTNGSSGALNQVIKKTGANSQNWSYITPSDISPGLVGQGLITGGGSVGSWAYINGSNFGTVSSNKVFTSDGSGVADFRNLPVSTITPGSNNQVLTTFSGTPTWNLLTNSNFANNAINTTLYYNGAGIPTISKLPAININPGSNGDIMVTSTGITNWATAPSLTLSGVTYNTDVNQTKQDYFNEVFNDILPMVGENGLTISVDVSYQRIGKKVSIRVDTRSVTYTNPELTSFYRDIGPIPSIYRPLYGIASDQSDWHSECFPCEQSLTGFVSGAGFIGASGIIRIYTNVDRSVPAAGTVTSFTHTFNYMID